MTKLTLFVPRLVASIEDRVLSGLVLPFGEPGQTNLGKLTASAETALDIAPMVVLNKQHNRDVPLGKALALETAPEGIRASFKVLETRDGDDALLEAKEGLRCGLSVELEPVVVRDGRIISGTISQVGHVVEPAFPSARLSAAEMQPVPDMGGDIPEPTIPDVVIDGESIDVETVTVSPEVIDITTKTADPATIEEDPTMTAAVVQNPALVAAQPKAVDSNALFQAVASGFAQGLTGNRLEAALSDVIPGNILGIEQPQYVGEMWAGVPYSRRFIPLFNSAPLTSYSIKGWNWTTAPAVAAYGGDKADIPSAAIATAETSGVLQRFAGGHDIDRKFRDFSNADFWASYFKKMAESYAKVSDVYIRDAVKAVPTAGNSQRVHLLTGNAPSGVPTALWQIVKGCIKMIDDLDTLPTFALVTSDYWEALFYTQQEQVLAYLNAQLGFKEGTLEGQGFRIQPVPTGSLTVSSWVGKTLVGHREAITTYELPGSPIRIEAEAISKGGIDEAVFGYIGYMVENVKGLISYDAPAAS